MNALKEFADGAAGACETMLEALSQEKQDLLGKAVERGATLSLAMNVDASGNSSITLEVVSGERRHVVASVAGSTVRLH